MTKGASRRLSGHEGIPPPHLSSWSSPHLEFALSRTRSFRSLTTARYFLFHAWIDGTHGDELNLEIRSIKVFGAPIP
ncbi:MAG: hypothetical protein EA397_16025 [Deltaproteobacteria bacterium]|nr:MAG: hypothetical protein EA397_16025 [Deltaproteobacteria bacterium]